jgi:hypothetical protein
MIEGISDIKTRTAAPNAFAPPSAARTAMNNVIIGIAYEQRNII